MKKVMILFSLLFALTFIAAAPCDLTVSLLNQDPYPAVPGDYVDVVFQVSGVENPKCGEISFQLLEKYPISFDPNTNPVVIIQSGTFVKDHSSILMIPYELRVDEDALDGDNPIEVSYTYDGDEGRATLSEQFNLNIKDVRAEFEIYVSDYEPATNTLTIEILNIADTDVEAVSLNIPKQDAVVVKGSRTNIVGDIDSNEYTNTDYEATVSGNSFDVMISYTDAAGIRRSTTGTVEFESNLFQNRSADQGGTSAWTYIILILIVGGIGYWIYKRRKKKKK